MAKPITARKLSKLDISELGITEVFNAHDLWEVPGTALVRDILGECDLDWETRIRGVCVADKMRTKIPGYYATYRSDNDHPLGVIRGRYTPQNNYDTFAWMNHIVSDPDNITRFAFGGVWEDAFGSQKTFLALHTGTETIIDDPANDDVDLVEKYVVMVNSHDASSNIMLHGFLYRRRTRTIMNFYDPKDAYKIRHTQGARVKLSEVRDSYNDLCKRLDATCRLFTKMAKTKLAKPGEEASIIGEALGVDPNYFSTSSLPVNPAAKKQPQWFNHHRAVSMIYHNNPWEKLSAGTLWGVYVAVAAYYDHIRLVRGVGKCADTAVASRLFGHAAKAKYQAFVACERELARRKEAKTKAKVSAPSGDDSV
jgi:hypothetical protein